MDWEGRGWIDRPAVARRAPLEPGEVVTRSGPRFLGVALSLLLVAITPSQRTLLIHLEGIEKLNRSYSLKPTVTVTCKQPCPERQVAV